jgi:hypothetical protein
MRSSLYNVFSMNEIGNLIKSSLISRARVCSGDNSLGDRVYIELNFKQVSV